MTDQNEIHDLLYNQSRNVSTRNQRRTIQKEQLDSLLQWLPVDINNIIFSYIDRPFIIVLHPINFSIKIPSIKSTDNLYIDWDDGTSNTYYDIVLNEEHKCYEEREHIVHIYGKIADISFESSNDLQEISQWGDLLITDGNSIFKNCINLKGITAIDTPNLTQCTTTYEMFSGCSTFNANLSEWTVSNITNMTHMFYNCSSFNCNLSNWNVSNVTDMSHMFYNCTSFNGDLSNWNVSNVTRMRCMFYNCSSFNCNLSNWNVSNVTEMSYMFLGCILFKSNLDNWNVSNVTETNYMFNGCSSFNGDLSRWNVSNNTNTWSMFYNCTSFNGDLSRWDVSNVGNMKSMFEGCSSFNCDLSNWDVSRVFCTRNMFDGCSSFNYDLSKWNIDVVSMDKKFNVRSLVKREVNGIFPVLSTWLRYFINVIFY